LAILPAPFSSAGAVISTMSTSLHAGNSLAVALLMFQLHNGKIIPEGFRWVLNALAIMTLLMVITGPILWWRRKW
jgi:uncharacterized iron-regulated membrane protein